MNNNINSIEFDIPIVDLYINTVVTSIDSTNMIIKFDKLQLHIGVKT